MRAVRQLAVDVEGWKACDPTEQSRQLLHRKAFRASHSLAHHPLFSIESLMQVARDAGQRPGDLYFDAGNVAIADKWGEIPVPDRPIKDIIGRIETAGAWIVMKHVERNPAYAAVLHDWAEFVRDIAEPSERDLLLNPEMLVFITSPNRITPFHFDAEVNFLVQISGSKELWVCSPDDRDVTTEDEIENYYAVGITAGNYKRAAAEKAAQFTLYPGDAVHIPTHGAHWVQNHDNISVSLSLNFEFPSWRYADVYRANHYLRRLGLSPRSPGTTPWMDSAKAATVEHVRSLKRATRQMLRGA